MSFMYESMMSRAPGKRKIKLQEENILRLMQDDGEDEEEEDDDFNVNDKIDKLASESSSSSDSSNDASSSSSESDDSSSCKDISNSTGAVPVRSTQNLRKSTPSIKRHCRRRRFVAPTIRRTNDKINSKYTGDDPSTAGILAKAKQQFQLSTKSVFRTVDVSSTKICCVCLQRKNPDNILVCNSCGIFIHKDCYGGKADYHPFHMDVWFCVSCISGVSPVCEFCPNTNGCMKETTNGQWCHVVCARYILGKRIVSNGNDTDLIDISELNYKEFGARECLLCEDRLVSKTGICVKCDAGLCKSYFHVTCAQKNGLLSENETDQNCDTDPYFVYCPLHLGKEAMISSQKSYIAAFGAVDLAKKKYVNGSQKEIQKRGEVLTEQRQSYVKSQHSRFPCVAGIDEPPSRKLTSNAEVLKLLNRKAEAMFGVDVRSSALYFPKPSDIRKRHHVAPALTGEFVSHYADRELRIVEMQERIQSTAAQNRFLLQQQDKLRQEYETLQKKLEMSQKKEDDSIATSRGLFSMFLRLKNWSNENKVNERSTSKITEFTPLKRSFSLNIPIQQKANKRPSSEKRTNLSTKIAKTSANETPSGLLKTCDVCKSNKEQHLMVDCDVCKRWLHLSCLDPPLAQIPKKSKFSLWQCSECIESSDNDSETDGAAHGSLITAEGRRHTRRSHKPPEKLCTTLLHDHNLLEQRRMINQITRLFRKSHSKKKSYYRSRLQSYMRRKNNDRGAKKCKEVLASGANNKPTCLENHKNVANTKLPEDETLPSIPKQDPAPIATQPSNNLVDQTPPTTVTADKRPINPNPLIAIPIDFKKLAPVIGKPVILPTGLSSKLPTSVVPVKMINKSGLISSKYPVLASPSVVDSLQRMVTSLGVSSSTLQLSNSQPQKNSSSSQVSPTKTNPTSTIVSAGVEGQKRKDAVCDACKSGKCVNKMMYCQTCKNHYHIWCCDPPLPSRFKINKFVSWECSNCHKSNEDLALVGGSETSPDGRRKITRRRKPPEKFANIFYSSSQNKMLQAVLGKRSKNIKGRKIEKSVVQRKLKKRARNQPSTKCHPDLPVEIVAPGNIAVVESKNNVTETDNSVKNEQVSNNIDNETACSSSTPITIKTNPVKDFESGLSGKTTTKILPSPILDEATKRSPLRNCSTSSSPTSFSPSKNLVTVVFQRSKSDVAVSLNSSYALLNESVLPNDSPKHNTSSNEKFPLIADAAEIINHGYVEHEPNESL